MKTFSQYLPEKTSLEYHDTLNPKLWKNESLDPLVRRKLLEFARAWQKFAKIPDIAIVDIIMTGGNANYNYTPQSDIDVHIVVKKERISKNNELVDDYLYDKKVLWTLTHNITVFGYSIEPYAQDENEKYPPGQGVFSLMNNKWVQRPENKHLDFSNDKHLERKVKYFKRVIDDMIKHKMDSSKFDELRKKISSMRGEGIARAGEFAFENLVFKELRNDCYLEKMNNYQKTLQDRALSL
jgi:hypothetical protein